MLVPQVLVQLFPQDVLFVVLLCCVFSFRDMSSTNVPSLEVRSKPASLRTLCLRAFESAYATTSNYMQYANIRILVEY